MTNTVVYPLDPVVGEEFSVGDIIKVWDGVKWVNKNNNEFIPSLRQLEKDVEDEQLLSKSFLIAQGLSGNYGFFSKGFTYTLAGDVGIGSNGKIYTYAGSDPLPVNVAPETDPVGNSDYKLWNLDSSNIRDMEIADIIAEDAPIGTRYRATDLDNARYDVVASSDTGGLYYTTMSSGRKLKLVIIAATAKKEINLGWLNNTKPNDESFDNAPALQSALDFVGPGGGVNLHDFYYIKSHAEERTNGGRRVLRGIGRKISGIIAANDFSSVARGFMLWFGTDTGHFSYGLEMYDIQIDANDKADGCVYAGENGQGIMERCEFRGFKKYGIRTSGATDAKFEKLEFYTTNTNTSCIVATCTGTNGAQDPSGYSFSYSALSFTPSNEVKFKDIWMSGASQCIWANGERVSIEGITSQSCGDGLTDDVVVITASAFDSDDINNNFPIAGPIFSGVNWWEGGSWRSALRVSDYAGGTVQGCYIVGSSSAANTVKEQGIIIDVGRTTVKNNSFYQFFTAPTTEGREDNAAVYMTTNAKASKEYENTYERTQAGNKPYFEGTASPSSSKFGFAEACGVIEWTTPTTPVLTSSTNIVTSVVHVGTGQVAINLAHNVETRDVVVSISTGSTEPTDSFEALVHQYKWQTNSSIRVQVFDLTGAGKAPKKLSFAIYSAATTASY